MKLKERFLKLITTHSKGENQMEKLWSEIEQHHTQPYRHYHNLEHLEHLFSELEPIKSHIEDWDTICFSVFYHDIIYELGSKDNEKNSAEFAKDRLKKMNYSNEKIDKCYNQIMATKAHEAIADQDTNYFTDADLSIMGSSRNEYVEYTKKIRKEYSIYSDEVFNQERKKILQHFLNLPEIFKTEYFFNKYEKQARFNLKTDLQEL